MLNIMGSVVMLMTSMWFISKIDFYMEGTSKKSVCTIYINIKNSRIKSNAKKQKQSR